MCIRDRPDGKPFFAGTYFPKDKWINALLYFADIYKKEPQKIIDQATRITQGLQEIDLIPLNQNERTIDKRYLEIIWENWKDKLDYDFGGRKGAPKFMMPNTLEFLFRLQHHIDDNSVATYLKTTLKKMAFGGLKPMGKRNSPLAVLREGLSFWRLARFG